MRQEGLWGSLSESRNTNSSKLVEAPRALFRDGEQAEKAAVSAETPFWDWPWMNFRADLPFNEMRQGFAVL
jgi:hypothetical protein